MANTTIPQQVGPMLDQVSTLVNSIPGDRISDLLDESFKAFNGAGYDFQSLLDSSSKLTDDLNSVSDQTRGLIDDSGPLLDSQAETTDAIRTWARSLAGVTQQVAQNDPQVRAILQRGPGFAQEVSGLLTQVKPTLPVLLANLTTLGQILVTYNPSLEQLLVMLPAVVAAQQSFGLPKNNPTGLPEAGDFAFTISDPPSCTVGFLPPSQWRNPADTTSHRHTGRVVLQTAAGLADRGARRPQLPLHGTSRKTRAHSRTLRRSQGVSAAGHARTRAGTVPVRPESDRAGRPAR